MDKKQLSDVIADTIRALGPFYRQAMTQAIQEIEAPNSWFWLMSARGSDPQPLTVEHLHARSPYNSPGRIARGLEELAGMELLEMVGQGAFRLTDLGREAIEGVYQAAHQAVESIDFLPADDLAEINALLWRVVEASLAAPEPAEKWSLIYSRWSDPGENGTGVQRMDQYLTDLYCFRDDAHLAAWQRHAVSGPAWEALTFVWRDQAHTAQELHARLSNRGLTEQDYAQALRDLVGRGWLEEKEGLFELTPAGKQVREKAEEDTDRYSLVGLAALDDDETVRLHDLLSQTKASLRAAALKQIRGLGLEISQALYALTRGVMTEVLEAQGMTKPPFFFFLLFAQGLAPDPISSTLLHRRSPYSKRANASALLDEMVEASFFTLQGEDQYQLTDQGRAAVDAISQAFYARLDEIAALPDENMVQIASLLDKIVQASLETAQHDTFCLQRSHRASPGQEYGPLATIDQRLDDLNALRDDAHLAAWQPHGVSGTAWEDLTFIWRGECSNAAELAERLKFRGYSAQDHEQELTSLVERGWLTRISDGYQLTPQSQAVRQQAEEDTDRYFFAPWAGLSDAESAQLHDLLTQLKNKLQEMIPDD